MRTIMTHTAPDFDAIGATWLLQRYGGLADAQVRFINISQPDPQVLDAASAVVDVGLEHDPARLRFDHHQLPGARASSTSATEMVFSWLCAQHPPHSLDHLIPIVNLINAVDCGLSSDGARWSQTIGLHAVLSGWYQLNGVHPVVDDLRIYQHACDLLDSIAATLQTDHEAERLLLDRTVYESDDGLLVAINNSTHALVSAAYQQGARLVVWREDIPITDGVSHGIGVYRAYGQIVPHVGELVDRTIDHLGLYSFHSLDQHIAHELRRWWKHPAGFYAGRGGAKGPCTTPVQVPVESVAHALDQAWAR